MSRISWKKTQANNPKYDPELVLKKEICELLETRRAGWLVVLWLMNISYLNFSRVSDNRLFISLNPHTKSLIIC